MDCNFRNGTFGNGTNGTNGSFGNGKPKVCHFAKTTHS